LKFVPSARLRPHLEKAIRQYGTIQSFVDTHRHLGIHERMVRNIMFGEHETVTMSTADKIVTAIDPMLWREELADLLPASRQPKRTSGRLRIPEAELQKLNELHVGGLTLHELGEKVWEQYGYASAVSAAACLRQAFDRRCWPCYPRLKGSPRRRPNRKLTDEQIASAWKMYQGGVSMGEMGRSLWRGFGYSSPGVCSSALSRYFVIRGLKGRRLHLGSFISDEMASGLVGLYEQGYSCCELGEMFWRELGYKNARACGQSINHRFRVDGVPLRSRAESVRLHNARHGSSLKGRMPPVVFGRRVELGEAA